MPQFDTAFYVPQIFWLFISFGFLYLMMSLLICPMIEEVFTERERRIKKMLDEAETLNQEANTLHQRYQAYLLTAEKEKSDKIQTAYARIQKKNLALERKNEASLRRQIRVAEQKINQASATLREESERLSTPLAEQLADHLKSGVSP